MDDYPECSDGYGGIRQVKRGPMVASYEEVQIIGNLLESQSVNQIAESAS